MPRQPLDPVTRLAFSIFENRGVYALLIGSGVSRAAEIPTGWEITLDLIRRVALADGETEQSDWAAWHRSTREQEPDYSALLAELATTPAERRSILHNYIDPAAGDREAGLRVPTTAHHAIARMVEAGFIRVIITTNFDRLIETALRERGIEPTVIHSVDMLAGAEPLTHATCYILKLHGDYKDARILNTEEELNAYPAPYDQLLDRIFDEFGLITCGWSADWDAALRSAMTRSPNRRYASYWTSLGPVSETAQNLMRGRAGQMIPITGADAFFDGLWDRLETLERTGKANPLSIDLQLATTKRHLSHPEERIQLDAVVGEELERALSRLRGEELPNQVSDAGMVEEIQSRVVIYEAASEALVGMSGVLGRWGQGTEFRLATDLIRSLHNHSRTSSGGSTWLLGLRAYPAVLAFTAYGLGLVRAERWEELHRLFQTPLDIPYEDAKPIVEVLFLNAWDAGGRDLWRSLEGYDRRYTPLSDHLFALFTDWAPRFMGLTPNFEQELDLFEMLAGVAFLEQNELPTLEQALADQRQQGCFVPVGRMAWRREASRVSEKIEGPLRDRILAAGFARGDEPFLSVALRTIVSNGSSLRRWG